MPVPQQPRQQQQATVNKPSAPYCLVKEGHACASDDRLLGHFPTLESCAEACATAKRCRFFSFGTARKIVTDGNRCYMEGTASRASPSALPLRLTPPSRIA